MSCPRMLHVLYKRCYNKTATFTIYIYFYKGFIELCVYKTPGGNYRPSHVAMRFDFGKLLFSQRCIWETRINTESAGPTKNSPKRISRIRVVCQKILTVYTLC